VLKEGYGFISTPDKAQNVFFYWGDVDGDFHDLKVGDQVEFELGTNEKGLVAKQVKSTTTAQIT
jgi:cold shock CspA family protein